jgi:hypothetical protein
MFRLSHQELAVERNVDVREELLQRHVSFKGQQPDGTGETPVFYKLDKYTVDSRLSARGLTALRLNRGSVFLKKKFYFP